MVEAEGEEEGRRERRWGGLAYVWEEEECEV